VVHRWKARQIEDQQWRPWNSTAHGLHHRVFTDNEEKAIADEIVNDYLIPWRQFGTTLFRERAFAHYAQTGRNQRHSNVRRASSKTSNRDTASVPVAATSADATDNVGAPTSAKGSTECSSCSRLSIITVP
jgi:hypothetical protein